MAAAATETPEGSLQISHPHTYCYPALKEKELSLSWDSHYGDCGVQLETTGFITIVGLFLP